MIVSPQRSWLIGLYYCPLNLDNPCHCQFHEQRKNKDFYQWYVFVRSLTEEEVEMAYTNHKKCICYRET